MNTELEGDGLHLRRGLSMQIGARPCVDGHDRQRSLESYTHVRSPKRSATTIECFYDPKFPINREWPTIVYYTQKRKLDEERLYVQPSPLS